MQTRKLGNLEVSALGLGCMGMSFSYATKLTTAEASPERRPRARPPKALKAKTALRYAKALDAKDKGDAATAKVPIVLVTAHAMKGNREEALASGADDYLTKPFSPSGLRELVQRFIPAGD